MPEDRTVMTPGELAERCGGDAAARLRGLLGEELLAAYLIGSGALGGVAPDLSDVDVVAVCATPLAAERKQAVIAAMSEQAMTWPLRGLELVLYARAAVAAPARRPQFEINLNTGPRMPLHVSLDPASEPAHWFVLDLAILRDHGRTLTGPPPRELVGPIPRRRLLEALRDSLAWHQANEPALHQTVLNASRGWRYAEEGVWSSKDDAAAWARPRTDDPALVEAALAVRHGDRTQDLDPARVRELVRAVRARVEAELEQDDPVPPPARYPFQRARDAFVEAYTLLDRLVASLTDQQLLSPTRCRGWAVCDLLCHLKFDMEEILVGLASPTDRPADTDFATYWEKCCTGGDPDDDLATARFVRLVASAYARPTNLVGHLRKLTGAVLRQAEAADPDRRLEFQGHVVAPGDFLATWVVEAAVHHLDLVVDLPDAPPPTPPSLAVTRETLDAMLGRPTPVPWDDATYALKGTGRLPLSDGDRAALGPLAERFPLFT
jgi:Mycothiol maleylpyruvate isomerase N-terminal domain/Domain of unknown function (DUF4111)